MSARQEAGEETSLRLKCYRRLASSLWDDGFRFAEAPVVGVRSASVTEAASLPQPIWFHAASVGELESLWTLAIRSVRASVPVVLTVFSPSAAGALARLVAEIAADGGSEKVLWAGYSPAEGRWGAAIRRWRPRTFVTAKYEAWPDLWATLAEERVPLAIVGAQMRPSIRLVRLALRWLGARIPALLFLRADRSTRPSHADRRRGETPRNEQMPGSLLTLFPRAREVHTGDPRWDRVAFRLERGSERARAIQETLSSLPRPWGVLGSAWPADLRAWGHALGRLPGTLFVVPHRTEPADSDPILELLRAFRGGGVIRTAGRSAEELGAGMAGSRSVLVDEAGFLLELYRAADWAYVGGGFGAGVHSTLEPALAGLEVVCGPSRAERFPEIATLRRLGALTVANDDRGLLAWAERRFSRGAGSGAASSAAANGVFVREPARSEGLDGEECGLRPDFAETREVMTNPESMRLRKAGAPDREVRRQLVRAEGLGATERCWSEIERWVAVDRPLA